MGTHLRVLRESYQMSTNMFEINILRNYSREDLGALRSDFSGFALLVKTMTSEFNRLYNWLFTSPTCLLTSL